MRLRLDQRLSSAPTALPAAREHVGIIVAVAGVGLGGAVRASTARPPLAPGAMQLERWVLYLWRIPREPERGMRVPGPGPSPTSAVIASIRSDAALEQLANGATLPGDRQGRRSRCRTSPGLTACPSARRGDRPPRTASISPGAIGFDINCGVRLGEEAR